MAQHKALLEKAAYCIMGLSIILFFCGILFFESQRQWDCDRISLLMTDAIAFYVILASFCGMGALMSGNNGHYHLSFICSIIPTVMSCCFMLFGIASSNNAISWAFMFFSSLGIYPILFIDKKMTHYK